MEELYRAIARMLISIIEDTGALPRDRLDALQLLREMFDL